MAEKFIKHRPGGSVGCRQCRYRCNHPETVLQKVTRTGFGAHLFNDWRFLDEKANSQTRTSC